MTEEKPRRTPWVRISIIALVGLLTIIIAFQNAESVDTRLLFATITMPRALLLLCTLVIGFLIGAATMFFAQRRSK